MPNLSLIVYHKNINLVYKREWIEEFKESILGQTYKDFKIYECNYGGTEERIFENSIYESKQFPTFIHAMNYLIEKCLDDGADVLANTNVDDVYSIHRLGVQMQYIHRGFDLVSSNFSLMRDGIIFHEHHFENLDIKNELDKFHNPICHPVVCYSKNFLLSNKYEPTEIPIEDLLLWKRSINDFKFIIAPENLLTQRIHDNSVCKSLNR